MMLSNPYYIEDLGLNQPYFSMLISSPNCDFSCEGCQNIGLKGTGKYFDIENLTHEYNDNPFFQGITVGGLEIFLSGDDFLLELICLIKATHAKSLTIYTRFEYCDKFVRDYINKIKKETNLDNLYLKVGKYVKGLECKDVSIGEWSIKLASSNQDFIKIL